ncbi:MAG: bifunctional 5,10-methylenetetrahydrofolate dehydrogenase/5,10-methenyltetrahydrofolate cyclohydrolase [Oscillospiraceae bacterium]
MISCKEYVEIEKQELQKYVSTNKLENCTLAVIQIGNNQASNSYIKGKKKDCEEIGIKFEHIKLEETIDEIALLVEISQLNTNDNVFGIIVQLPIPEHLDKDIIFNSIATYKDVDGFKKDSRHTSCTARGIIDWLDYNKVDLDGKNVTIIGRSNIVGKPLAKLFLGRNSTVTLCHSHTKNLHNHIINADIVISAIGKLKYISNNELFNKKQILIDVGINRDINNRLCGDFDYERIKNSVEHITPVPNGVGLLTRLALIKNILGVSNE